MLDILRRIVEDVSLAANLDEALGITVGRVRATLSVDVCSVYLFETASGEYVLRATEGLNAAAVGRVRLRPTEGLVGLVAERQEPVLVQDAANHVRYRYFPETGEERYRSFLGVPLIHYRQVLGVLVAQQRDDRQFNADESAFLVTVAAQLAGAIHHVAVTGGMATLLAGNADDLGYIEGARASDGVAIGTVASAATLADLGAVPDRTVTDVEAELERLRRAIAAVQDDLRASGARLAGVVSDSELALFDVYVMLLDGDTLPADMAGRVSAGQWAPAAIRDTVAAHVRLFQGMSDPYLRARADDIRELGRRIVMRLHADGPVGPREYPERCVLVGDEVSITDIANVPRRQLVGIVSGRSSAFSHVAVLARAMGLPAVVDVGELPLARLDGHTVVVDGYRGRVFFEPKPAVLEEFRRIARADERLGAELRALKDLPAETPDGARVTLHVNTGLLSDITPSLESGAEGVGLYRTEFPFMIRESFPGEEDQFHIYREVLAAFAPRPVTMRTLDIGGDKPLPYFNVVEANPFLGWRGIRVTLDHPEIFLTQLRAMLRANEDLGNLRVLLPMVSNVAEVDDALALIERARHELAEEGHVAPRPPIGVMIEVPAAVYQASQLARRVDFLSIGSNDLTQYLLAVDRTNARVARIYDSLHPAVLNAIDETLRAAREAGKPVSVCGDVAGEPAGTVLLLGMGFRHLSMTAAYLGRAKRVIRTISRARARAVLEQALTMEDAGSVHRLVRGELEAAGLAELLRGR
ncbi:MAG: phosphoenolpyruvate--protein phosphotransferase [Gammaproteobacteria bacterium]|nr:phosphoenolpyruvate--protein phosphotransferase [Gammaproteobacteria bacterium]